MAAIQCFNIPLNAIPQAVKVFNHAFKFAEKYNQVLSIDVRKNIALGQVTRWACQQDEPQNLARIAEIVRQAGDIVVSRYCFEESLNG
jgi:hypothetical protein